jgi:hypothetical protein
MTQHWLRVSPAIRSFILGEVERQYHPIGTEEYSVRVEWMTDAWQWALDNSTEYKRPRLPTIEDIQFLAAHIEHANLNGFRTCDVHVGDHAPPSYERVPQSMEWLWQSIDRVEPRQGRRMAFEEELTADDFYLAFERIHPFRDGNGRVGKILHNWLLGTLHDPVLVRDYFGGGNP